MEYQVTFPFIQPVFGVRGDMPALQERTGEDQSTLLVGFHLRHGSS
jgi:hypothetical protein